MNELKSIRPDTFSGAVGALEGRPLSARSLRGTLDVFVGPCVRDRHSFFRCVFVLHGVHLCDTFGSHMLMVGHPLNLHIYLRTLPGLCLG
jgi:hypothetical protein